MRFLITWLLSWVLFGLINIHLYECIDITVKAYLGVTCTVAWFAALLFHGLLDVPIEIKNNGKG